jgi:hypothetical protein
MAIKIFYLMLELALPCIGYEKNYLFIHQIQN